MTGFARAGFAAARTRARATSIRSSTRTTARAASPAASPQTMTPPSTCRAFAPAPAPRPAAAAGWRARSTAGTRPRSTTVRIRVAVQIACTLSPAVRTLPRPTISLSRPQTTAAARSRPTAAQLRRERSTMTLLPQCSVGALTYGKAVHTAQQATLSPPPTWTVAAASTWLPAAWSQRPSTLTRWQRSPQAASRCCWAAWTPPPRTTSPLPMSRLMLIACMPALAASRRARAISTPWRPRMMAAA